MRSALSRLSGSETSGVCFRPRRGGSLAAAAGWPARCQLTADAPPGRARGATCGGVDAAERTRTSTPRRAQAPEACASTNSATAAGRTNLAGARRRLTAGAGEAVWALGRGHGRGPVLANRGGHRRRWETAGGRRPLCPLRRCGSRWAGSGARAELRYPQTPAPAAIV